MAENGVVPPRRLERELPYLAPVIRAELGADPGCLGPFDDRAIGGVRHPLAFAVLGSGAQAYRQREPAGGLQVCERLLGALGPDPVQPDPAPRESAGLVEAQDVDPAERLDGARIPDQRATLRQPPG